MSVPMPYASSSSPYGPLSGPSPPVKRRKVATGRWLTPLPPSLLSSSSSAVTTGEGAGSDCRPRQDAQRPLPPAPQLDRKMRHEARSASSKTAASAASVRLLFAETAPTSRPSRPGSDACRVSENGRMATRPLSEEGQSRHGSTATGYPTPQIAKRLSNVPTKPSVAASCTVAQGRPKPCAPASNRSGCTALLSDPAARQESNVPGPAATHANKSRLPPHPERNGRQQTRQRASLRVVQRDDAATRSESLVTDARSPSPSADQRRAPVDLPYAPHDMDEPFFTDAQHWKTEEELPGPVWALLEGAAVEAPYTTDLWTQAYTIPAELLSAGNESASELPGVFLHREAQQRTHGFYACVRCGTPVCDPVHQVIPASDSLRGIAVFDALHMKGVKLCVSTPTLKGKAQRLSRMRHCSLSSSRAAMLQSRVDGYAELDAAGGGLRFLVHCRHCNGCLGAMRLGDSARADSANGFKPSTLETTLDTAPTTALFCANSVCLAHMPYRTRARLDQTILDNTAPYANAVRISSGSSDGGGKAIVSGRASVAAPAQSRVALGSLFGSPNGAVAWGLEEATDGDREVIQNDASYVDEDNDNSDGSFGDLLAELNPYGNPTPISSSDDSDG